MTDPISFASTSPRLGLPLLFSGQAQKEITVNEGLMSVDRLLHGTVEGELSTPPSLPAVGQVWLVGSSPSAAFTGHTGHLAGWSDGGWRFHAPTDGMQVFDRTAGCFRLYAGGWRIVAQPAAPTGGAVIDTQARAVIAALIAALRNAGVFSAL